MDDRVARFEERFEKVDTLSEMVKGISNQLQLVMHNREALNNCD